MSKAGQPSVTEGWDTYWQGTRDADSFASRGERHPAITAFWDDALPGFLAGDSLHVLDVATGSGAVVESLFRNDDARPDVTCVDISEAAIAKVCERYPSVSAIVSDARSIPLDDATFDLVTSQFGIEYAGTDAFDEAVRLLKPGGSLVTLNHIRPGAIYRECWASLDAVRRMKKSRFLPLALEFFEAGFAAVGGADRAAYDKAARAMNPALREVERILEDHGEDVAGGTVARLYADIETIHRRIQQYEPAEVIEWLRGMMAELDAYEARMASMSEAAMDKKTFRGLCRRLEQQGLTVVARKPLETGRGALPIAWTLHAVRPDGS